MKFKFILMMTGLQLVSSIYAAGPFRCAGKGIPVDLCETLRRDAIGSGCIDQPTYDRFKSEDIFPMCMGSTLLGDCPCGCFATGTSLLAYLNIDELEDVKVEKLYSAMSDDKPSTVVELLTLNAGSSIASPNFGTHVANQATVGVETEALVSLKLSSGRTLSVTSKHPIVLSSGKMVRAREITLGSELVDSRGATVSVIEIDRVMSNDPVYNFSTAGDAPEEHIIVAEGVLVGDLTWQNRLNEEQEGIALRQ